MFSLRPYRHALCRALALISICAIPVFAQATVAGGKQRLYLLAATPMNYGGRYGFPATLYSAAGGKLKFVRTVVPGTEGVRSVFSWANTIFLNHPLYAGGASATAIIHTQDPSLVDGVTFNPAARRSGEFTGFDVVSLLVTLAEARPAAIDELLPISKDLTHPGDTAMVGVSSDVGAVASRVTQSIWNEYSNLRREGDPGGPMPAQGLVGAMSDDNLVLPPAFGHPVVIDSLPASIRGAAAGTTFHKFLIIAASQRYLLLKLAHSFDEFSSGKLGNSVEMFVHDRMRDRWKTIEIEGDSSRSRLFGTWLATIAAMFTSDRKPNPGIENERSFETEHLPNVRNAYAHGQGGNRLPGILVLQNIEDGRKIRIETGQEDSEILSVTADSVLYRVNDTIYQAQITGDHLQDTAAIVKDDDVPEVHWVFWSQ
jgi:hypothetical protein